MPTSKLLPGEVKVENKVSNEETQPTFGPMMSRWVYCSLILAVITSLATSWKICDCSFDCYSKGGVKYQLGKSICNFLYSDIPNDLFRLLQPGRIPLQLGTDRRMPESCIGSSPGWAGRLVQRNLFGTNKNMEQEILAFVLRTRLQHCAMELWEMAHIHCVVPRWNSRLDRPTVRKTRMPCHIINLGSDTNKMI